MLPCNTNNTTASTKYDNANLKQLKLSEFKFRSSDLGTK